MFRGDRPHEGFVRLGPIRAGRRDQAGHEEHLDRARGGVGPQLRLRHGLGARDGTGRPFGHQLEVTRGDRSAEGVQLLRSPDERVLERLPGPTARCRLRVVDGRLDRVLDGRQDMGRDVPVGSAAAAVPHSDLASPRRDGGQCLARVVEDLAVVVDARSRRRREHDRAGRPVDHVDVHVGTQVGEVVDRPPDPIRLAVVLRGGVTVLELARGGFHGHDQIERIARGCDDRRPGDRPHEAGIAGGDAERLGLDQVGVVGANDRLLPARRDRRRLGGDEDGRLAAADRSSDRHAGPARDLDRSTLALLPAEPQADGRRGRRLEAHADQPQELDEQLVRDAVEAIDQGLGEIREHLDQDDPGIAGRKVRPIWGILADARDRAVHQLLPGPIVEVGGFEWHQRASPVRSRG